RIVLVDTAEFTDLRAGDRPLLAITDADSKAAGKTRQQLAQEYKPIIAAALQDYREARRMKNLAVDIALVTAATIMLLCVWFLVYRVDMVVQRTLRSWQGTRIRDLRVQRVDVLAASRIVNILSSVSRVLRIATGLVAVYFYIVCAL